MFKRRQRYHQKIKRRRDDDFMHSSSSATAFRIASSYLKHKIAKAEEQRSRTSWWLTHKDQEQCDGFSTKRKLSCTNPSYKRKEIWMGIRYDCWVVVLCRLPLRVLLCFLVSLVGFVTRLSLGDVAPTPSLLFEFVEIQHSISLCDISCLFSVLWDHFRTRCIADCP